MPESGQEQLHGSQDTTVSIAMPDPSSCGPRSRDGGEEGGGCQCGLRCPSAIGTASKKAEAEPPPGLDRRPPGQEGMGRAGEREYGRGQGAGGRGPQEQDEDTDSAPGASPT